MRITAGTLAVFWSRPGWATQHHANMPRASDVSLREAVAAYRELFPDDVVHSVRDQSGRFQPFKETRA